MNDVAVNPDTLADQLVAGEIAKLRAFEAEFPTLPKFDESTLPQRLAVESHARWRERQVDVILAHQKRLMAYLNAIAPIAKLVRGLMR